MKTTLKSLRRDLKSVLREIKWSERLLGTQRNNAKLLQKQINEFPKPIKSLPRHVKKLSSKKRYEIFNAMLRRNGHSGIYRDGTKRGVSVKVYGLSTREKSLAVELCDRASVTFHHSEWDRPDVRNRTVRYIFNIR